MKNYIGISRDHSGSMASIANAAKKDYNANVNTIRQAAINEGIDTVLTTVKCGDGHSGTVAREIVNSSISAVKSLDHYEASAPSTPLFDSVQELIDILSGVPDINDPEVTFLVMVITDGQDNSSKRFGHGAAANGRALAERIRILQGTDRWTFTFRVPRGEARPLSNLGIPLGNILEWDQSERGMAQAQAVTQQAVRTFYSSRKLGVRSTQRFYTDLADVKPADLKRELQDITGEVQVWENLTPGTFRIDEFTTARVGGNYIPGKSFYQLVKSEKAVQDYKKIAIRDRNTTKVFGGNSARQMLGLPDYGSVALSPGDHKNYEIFIQSMSLNRAILPNMKVLYWPSA